MYKTPPSKVLTRKQRQEIDKLNENDRELHAGGTNSIEAPRDKEEIKSETMMPSLYASVKKSSRAPTGNSRKSTASSVARRRQMELEAAEARAKIELDLIEKRLAANLAKVDAEDEMDDISSKSSINLENQVKSSVEKWLDRHSEPTCHPEHPVKVDAPNVPHCGASSAPARGAIATQSVTVHAEPTGSDLPKNSIELLAHTLKDLMDNKSSQHENRLLSRLATPRELPNFNGDCVEWLQFKSAYYESTQVCKFSDSENLWRLRRALRGDAKEAVTDLLIGNTPPIAVMEALQLRFGQPDHIIHNATMQLKKLPSLPLNYQTELISFSVKINNFVAVIRALNQLDYLRSPELVTAVLSKLPSTLTGKWTEYAYNKLLEGQPKLELIATFLKREAEMLATVGVTLTQGTHKHTFETSRDNRGYGDFQNKTRNRQVFTTSVAIDDNNNCRYCKKTNHLLTDCRIFKKAMRKDKWRFLKTQRLCYCCLIAHHNSNTCSEPVCNIDNCGLKHHSLLHWTKPTPRSADDNNKPVSPESDIADAVVAHVAKDSEIDEDYVLLKVVPVTVSGPAGTVNTYAILDGGAAVSMLEADLANSLGLVSESSCSVKLTDAFGIEVFQSDAPKVRMQISDPNSDSKYDITLRKAPKLKLCVQNLDVINKLKCKHLEPVKQYVCKKRVTPRILIGEDNYYLFAPLEIIHGGINEPYATRTRLGWCVHGYYRGRSHSSKEVSEHNILHLAHSHDDSTDDIRELNELIKNSFILDSVGISNVRRENSGHLRAMQILDDTARHMGNQWEVGLPFKQDQYVMPDSYNNALSRLRSLSHKFQKDTSYADRYSQEVQKLFNNGYARELNDDELSADHVWYLPHFGVQNPNKPDKLRLVFDAAAKVEGTCLNDYLLTGPDLYNSLLGIMLRFRENQIVIIGDIKDMFLRIKIRSEDQHVLRFLWQDSPEGAIKVCAMTSLVFGATCSPFIAQHIRNKNALKYEDLNPEAVQVILNNHYMDDCLYSTNDEQKAIKLVTDITSIHKNGGFEIRGWMSNSKPVLDSIPIDALAQSAIQFQHGSTNTTERTLGLMWYPTDDTFGFRICLDRIPSEILNGSVPPTKSKMLSIIMSIYDVHGFLSPFVIKSKIILQNVHRSGVDWKCHIQPQEHTAWMNWLNDLKQIESLRIPRCLMNSEAWTPCYEPFSTPCLNSVVSTQLHIFCDASLKAYAAVIYWRFIRADGSVLVSFAAAKSRVTPLRPISVPRLELQGAVIAARLADTVQREQKDLKPVQRYFWTDSSTVLQWIRSDPRNYKSFVAHRLGEIDELTKITEWRYVPSRLNVADVATKEDSPPLEYSAAWFHGPQFLHQNYENWPKDLKSVKCVQEAMVEERNVHLLTQACSDVSLPNEEAFSSWLRLVRSTARVLLFVRRCRKKNVKLDVELMKEAEGLLIKKCQKDSFSQDIERVKQNKHVLNNSRLLKLSPYLDDSGILRLGGRIDRTAGVDRATTRPAIMDGNHKITRLLVEHSHRRALHGAHEMVVNELRQRYWIVRLRPTVRAVAARCLFCRYRRAVPRPQRMADLPSARLQHNRRPFTFTGIDFFGPMEVTVGRSRQKRYGMIFTCLTTRAIHIELAENLTTDATILALRRMIARRGTPSVIYSDNGTNFRGAHTELKQCLQALNADKLQEDGAVRGIEWRFIPPGAPEMGGAWERMIRTVKTALKVVLKERAPHPDTLITLLAEVEALVNSRPITHVSTDSNYPEALTPNHFLIGTSSNGPSFDKFDDNDLCFRKRWRIAQRLTDMFWGRWVKEYLPTLLPRQKWTREERALRDGDYVLLIEPNLERGSWRHGVVTATHPGRDGRVRVVDVRTRSGILRRPVTRVALLSPSDD